jgi:cyclic dehypoxanthinyl futalosine synthase
MGTPNVGQNRPPKREVKRGMAMSVMDLRAASATPRRPPDAARCREILDHTLAGQRLRVGDAVYLLERAPLHDLAAAADEVRRRRFPEGYATFIIDRNINYTNVCITRCKFCAFYRLPGDVEGWLLPLGEIFRRIEEAMALGATQIMLQGGHDPRLKIEYYERLLSSIRAHYPSITLHSLTPSEVLHISKVSRLPVAEVLRRLTAAGLASLPGGGAEILVDRVREQISPLRATTNEWLGVMEEAHRQGIRTTSTMMLGHVETPADRVEHFRRLRDLQDRAAPGQGFRAFIPWIYAPGNTELGGQPTTADDYLRTLAVSRLFFDNVDHVQGSWLTTGLDVGRASLACGADDLGSIMLEENVVRAAGSQHCLTELEMVEMIRECGRIPARRNTAYEILELY